ncbi:MAG: DJ-1/PfpI family protein [Nitrospiraceae bacterium]
MPGFEWHICALTADVADDKGLHVAPSVVRQPLADYDLIVVPGGMGTRALQRDKTFIDWLRTSEPVKLKASVCTGSLLLGAAGFLKGRRATTNRNASRRCGRTALTLSMTAWWTKETSSPPVA